MYIENIKRNPITRWTNYFGDVVLPGDTTGRDANALPSHMTPAYTALNLDSGVGEQVATIGGQYGILLTVLYDRDWILDTVETFHPNVSESSVVELFGAALPCIANAMSDDLRDSLKDNGAARMRDDIHILYGQIQMWTDTKYSFSYRSIRIPTFVQKLFALLKNISMSTLVEKT